MQSVHGTIEKIINHQDHCIFCQSKLKTILTNHINFKNVPTLNSKYDCKNKKFDFTLNHNSSVIDLKAEGWIDAVNNFLIFDKPIESDYYNKGAYKYSEIFEETIRVFNKISPHVESYCPSRKCGLKYYLSSNIFYIWNITYPRDNKSFIPNVWLSEECFNINHFWIQNDLVRSKTNIYSIKNPNLDPIAIDLIDFSSLNKTHLINRIKTLITFS